MSISKIYTELLDVAALVQFGLSVPSPATREQIADLEAKLGFPLPLELAEVLLISNGSSAAVFGDDAGINSVDEILSQFEFAEGAVQASPGVAKIPFSRDNGVFAFIVADPKHKKYGHIGVWDPDGEPYGELRGFKAKSFMEMLEKALKRQMRSLPKGMPMLTGLAFGKDPSSEEFDALVTGLARSKKPVDTALRLFDAKPELQRRLIEELLQKSPHFITHEEHDEFISKHADTISVTTVLGALRHRRVVLEGGTEFEYQTRMSYESRYITGWTAHMDDVLVTLIARDPEAVEAASSAFGPVAKDGYTLVKRRLGLSDEPLTTELKTRIARECGFPAHRVRYLVNGETADKEWVGLLDDPEAGLTGFEFALTPFFDSLDEHARLVLDYVLERDDIYFPRWVGGPCMRVATLDELEIVFKRMGRLGRYDILQNLDTASRPVSALLAEVAPRFATPVHQTILFCACVAAAREGSPLPEVGDLSPGILNISDPIAFVREFAPTFKALGAERVARAFAGHPNVVAAFQNLAT